MRVELSAGWAHAFTQNFGAVMQLNLRHRARDTGTQVEPANSGSTRAEISPGITLGVGQASTLYASASADLPNRLVKYLISGALD